MALGHHTEETEGQNKREGQDPEEEDPEQTLKT
jgi:hypothetical protein